MLISGVLCKPGSPGQNFIGVQNTILDPDDEGFGEIAVRSRNVFMGYHKDQVKTEESFQVLILKKLFVAFKTRILLKFLKKYAVIYFFLSENYRVPADCIY